MKIFIGSSSRNEINKEYLDLAEKVGKELKKYNYDLVFGAASTGMMGKITKYFNNIYSYTVEKYAEDLKNINSKKEYILKTTFDRTKKMYKDANLLLLLPGGTGTLSELFGILEENRSVTNPKKYIIFNYNHYYDKALELIDNCIKNNFNSKDIKDYYEVVNNIEELIKLIENKKSTN